MTPSLRPTSARYSDTTRSPSRARVEQCRLLVEMLADDAARRATGPVPLARPGRAGRGGEALLALGAAETGTVERIERLAAEPRPHRLLGAAVYLLACGLVVLPVLIVVAPLVLR